MQANRLLAGIVGLSFLGFTALADARSDAKSPDLQGHWGVQDAESCYLLCTFTLTNLTKGNNEKMRLQFDKDTWSEEASGTLLHAGGKKYQLSDGKIVLEFELDQDKLTIMDGATYKRIP